MNYAHIGFAVKDLEKSKTFYAKALNSKGKSFGINTLAAILMTGFFPGVLAYIIAVFIVPKKP